MYFFQTNMQLLEEEELTMEELNVEENMQLLIEGMALYIMMTLAHGKCCLHYWPFVWGIHQ